MKKQIASLLALMLVLACACALAADDGADPLTLEELQTWAAEVRQLAASSEPENDPHEEAALSEDGYAYVYSFGILYFDAPDLTDDTALRSFVLYDEEMSALRGTHVEQSVNELLAAFYTENPTLDGSAEEAVLYWNDNMPSSASWGYVLRDGQRVGTVEYAACEQPATDGDGYLAAGVVYTIQEGTVAAIRAYGLADRTDNETVEAACAELRAAAEVTGYTAVATSISGDELTPFSAEDMILGGVDLLTASPEEAAAVFGEIVSDELVDDDTGYIRSLTTDTGVNLVYTLSGKDADPVLNSISFETDGPEGPRGVRVGDSLVSVRERFRFGEEESDGVNEVLYGTLGTDPYGICSYGDDASAMMQYTIPLEGGHSGVLSLEFHMLTLTSVLFLVV